MSLELFRQSLADLPLGRTAYLETIGSTNDVALEWGRQGAPDLSLVYAEEQTAGRGRGNRKWFSRPGAALTFSLLLRPTEIEHLSLGRFSIVGALAVCAALEDIGLSPQIKWPNDVLVEGRKVCGILVESLWQGEKPDCIVIGIGLNVTAQSVPPDNEVLFPASSLEQVGIVSIERHSLLRSILEHFIRWRKLLHTVHFLQEAERRLAFRNQWVAITSHTTLLYEGKVDGLQPNGGLRLTTREGKQIEVDYGEIHLRPLL
ncbi:MAG: biotin--[acetyl-CoA-carboxylase] ligase [Anaerolineales bacterium]|nr:biotin--[acetyl-CoA-carboxylase] ligase [Anaerolineales bacterium]MCX7608830.1 biotin--[acetyl-CoA-carboxylase] ligase [Anaerolineales bacterium]MDW8227310.1 biotin--[acetyl-CoA-carboxylase] ligase [Anaerolineales bacterium]MDW8445928.1 biotin--[acetyl-CoA-carboxylase] ligase [Anaerolineales bacterium]